MNFKGESRFDAALVADAGANPASSKHLVAATPSIVRIAFGGTTVAIAAVIEGNPRDILAFSDLSRSSNFCQSVPNPPMKVGEPWATIGRAANYAGRWTNIPEQSLLLLSKQCRNSGGSGASLRAVSLRKPAIEKGARLRPQHLFFSRSRMGNSRPDAHVRRVAVALRLPSAILGAG